MQIWEIVENNVKIIGFLCFLGYSKQDESFGSKCVKEGLWKIGIIALDLSKK